MLHLPFLLSDTIGKSTSLAAVYTLLSLHLHSVSALKLLEFSNILYSVVLAGPEGVQINSTTQISKHN